MMARHSEGLILVWRLAELEARQQGSSAIEPVHLMLGLCKCVDIDLPAVVNRQGADRDGILEELLREIRRLRAVFETFGLDVRTFRRALRRKCGLSGQPAQDGDQHLRRSDTARTAFSLAEQLAVMADSPVVPVQLLFAVMGAPDPARDELLKLLGMDAGELREAARKELILPWNSAFRYGGPN